MNNNDRLSRLRYSLDIKDTDMVTIFDLGGVQVNESQVKEMLTKVKMDNQQNNEAEEDIQPTKENGYLLTCSDEQFERFLNGLITSQRGKKDGLQPPLELNEHNANNFFLKKVKIALSFT